jgi:hypothetical protein
MHHPFTLRLKPMRLAMSSLLLVIIVSAPEPSFAQTSPFMTGAAALQTKGRTLLAAATRLQEAFPHARISAFALLRTMGYIRCVNQLVDPCVGQIRWRAGDAHRSP